MYGAKEPLGAAAPAARSRRSRLLRALQLVATCAAFAYVLTVVRLDTLLAALGRVPPGRFAIVLALTGCGLALGALRWSLLFRAFGAPRPPAFGEVCRFTLVGVFYNTFLPGGVGGDVVRGLLSRNAWGAERAATSGLATVLADRVLGLAGLLGLVSLVALVHPLPLLGSALAPGVLGLCGAAAPMFVFSLAHRLAPRLPVRFGSLLARLPRTERFWPLLAAALLSLVIQVLPALSGHLLVSALDPNASLPDSLAIVPVAAASAFLPITVSGAGVREALFVTLYESVGVASEAALAASLSLWFALACLAAVGGWFALRVPLDAAGGATRAHSDHSVRESAARAAKRL